MISKCWKVKKIEQLVALQPQSINTKSCWKRCLKKFNSVLAWHLKSCMFSLKNSWHKCIKLVQVPASYLSITSKEFLQLIKTGIFGEPFLCGDHSGVSIKVSCTFLLKKFLHIMRKFELPWIWYFLNDSLFNASLLKSSEKTSKISQ